MCTPEKVYSSQDYYRCIYHHLWPPSAEQEYADYDCNEDMREFFKDMGDENPV